MAAIEEEEFDLTPSTTGSKFVLIDDPIPSDNILIGAEFTNQIVKLFGDVDVSSHENIRINTPFKFRSGRFMIYDSDRSHVFMHYAENIADGVNRIVRWRALTNPEDSPVMENEPQTISNKTLIDTTMGGNVDFDNFNLDDVGNISVRDLNGYNITLIKKAGVTPNTHIDILPNYNTGNYPDLVTASDVVVSFGYNSEIDKYEMYSSANVGGINELLLSLSPDLLDINVTDIDFNNANVSNLLLNSMDLKNQTGAEPTATAQSSKLYRKDIDANNQAIYISKIENGNVVKVRVS